MYKSQKWVAFFVALILLANDVFYTVWADDKHKEKRWY